MNVLDPLHDTLRGERSLTGALRTSVLPSSFRESFQKEAL